jgi:hypothetical protein
VAGLDIRDPAFKLPGFGRIGLPSSTANAALAPSRSDLILISCRRRSPHGAPAKCGTGIPGFRFASSGLQGLFLPDDRNAQIAADPVDHRAGA